MNDSSSKLFLNSFLDYSGVPYLRQWVSNIYIYISDGLLNNLLCEDHGERVLNDRWGRGCHNVIQVLYLV